MVLKSCYPLLLMEYENMFEELDKQFPNCPFIISCIDNLDELDEIFTYEPVIFIYDGRVNEQNY